MTSKKKRIILYSSKSPGPTKFFDPETYQYVNGRIVFDLVNSNVAELKIADCIPYIITLDVHAGSYFDTTKSCIISEAEAKRLLDSGVAELKIAVNSHPVISNVTPGTDHPSGFEGNAEENNDSENSDLKEKVLIGATAAGGTTAVAAGVASVPFLAGFTSTGVAAGSAAAGIQAGIGSVAAGSWFAVMQSVAATTLIGTALPAVVAGVAVAGTATGGVMLYNHIKKKKKQGKEEEIMTEIEVREAKAKGAEGLVVAVREAQEFVLQEDDDEPLLDPQDEPPAYEPPPPYQP